jgi:hypothetical protein
MSSVVLSGWLLTSRCESVDQYMHCIGACADTAHRRAVLVSALSHFSHHMTVRVGEQNRRKRASELLSLLFALLAPIPTLPHPSAAPPAARKLLLAPATACQGWCCIRTPVKSCARKTTHTRSTALRHTRTAPHWLLLLLLLLLSVRPIASRSASPCSMLPGDRG